MEKSDLKVLQSPGTSGFHLTEPDYSRSPYIIPSELKNRILNKLTFLYGEEKANSSFNEIQRLVKVYYSHKSPVMIEWEKDIDPSNRFTEKDVILIT